LDNLQRHTLPDTPPWTPKKELVKAVHQQFSTPAYIYDQQFLIKNYNNLRRQLSANLDIFYSLKANPNISITRQICKQGAGAEVSSLVELHTAIKAGVLPENIIFVGPAKTSTELKACIDHKIFAIVCESIDEIIEINAISKNMGDGADKTSILIRVNPEFTGVGAGLAMGGKPRQFGIDENQIRSAVEILKKLSSITILGFHVYMGTRYLDAQPVILNTTNILNLCKDLSSVLQIDLKVVDIGGGLGVPYFANETDINIPDLCAGMNKIIDAFSMQYSGTRIIMELGRFLVAGCGVMLIKVRHIKNSMGEKFIITDGGTNLHMAAVGIGSFVKRNFPIINFSSTSTQHETVNITGPLCTPNDILAKRIQLNRTKVGDILGVLYSGAYGPTASPTQFLSHGYPAEVIIINTLPHLIRQRDRPEDLLSQQILVTD